MYYLKLIFKNIFRAKLRSALTLTGLVIAVFAFGFLQTVVTAFFSGANAASGTRLVLTLLYELQQRNLRYGLASACIGGGQGIAMIVENTN